MICLSLFKIYGIRSIKMGLAVANPYSIPTIVGAWRARPVFT